MLIDDTPLIQIPWRMVGVLVWCGDQDINENNQ